jgi:hypothetical protein
MAYIPYIAIHLSARIWSSPRWLRALPKPWSMRMTGRPDLAEERDVAWEADADDSRIGIIPALPAKAPVYYRLPDTPEGHHIKEYASGLRQLVRFVGVEEQVVKYSLG